MRTSCTCSKIFANAERKPPKTAELAYHRDLFVLSAAGQAADGSLSDEDMDALLERPQ